MTDVPPAASPPPLTGRQRLWASMRPRATRSQLIAVVVSLVLGFGVATQVRSNRAAGLTTLRQDDLVRVLDEVTERSNRLEREAAELRSTQDRLLNGSDGRQEAIAEARRRIDTLAILAGTVPVTGPGIELSVQDPDLTVGADVLLNAVQELRDAGAEAMQVNGHRLIASSWLQGPPGAVLVDGALLAPPYRLVAIGDPATLRTALDIAGGVLRSLPQNHPGASGSVRELRSTTITATVPPATPKVGRPVPEGTPGRS